MPNGLTTTATPVFLGILFPFQKGPEGIPATETNEEIIKNDLTLLLNTRRGERVMLPTFGIDLERLIFDNTGPLLRAKAFRMVSDAISNWETRVSLVNVLVTEDTHTVIIDVVYEINALQDQVSVEFDRVA